MNQQFMQAETEQKVTTMAADAELTAKLKKAEGQRALLEAQSVTADILNNSPALLQLKVV